MTDADRILWLEGQVKLIVQSLESINRTLKTHNTALDSINECIKLLGRLEDKQQIEVDDDLYGTRHGHETEEQ